MGLPGTVKKKDFVKYLAHKGLEFVRNSDGHSVYDKADRSLNRPVIIQTRKKDIPRFIIKENLKTMGADSQDLLDFLKSS